MGVVFSTLFHPLCDTSSDFKAVNAHVSVMDAQHGVSEGREGEGAEEFWNVDCLLYHKITPDNTSASMLML